MTSTTSKVLAGATLAGLGVLTYARYVERLWIDVRRLWVAVDSPGLPLEGLRVLHVSDLHFTGHGLIERLKIERTVKLLAGEAIDLLLITGDLIHDDDGLPAVLELVGRLPRPRLGAFACLGNHDYAGYSWFGPARVAWREAEPGQELRAAVGRTIEMMVRIVKNDRLYLGQSHNDVPRLKAALSDAGVHVLQNSSARLQVDGADVWLAGIDDLMEGQPDVAATLAGQPSDGALRILLAHNPDFMLKPSLQQCDLACCGHVHGGQVLLPLLGALHTQGTHLARRHTHGWFQYGRAQTYIGKGLGEGVRLRFRCRPEVALIQVTRSSLGRPRAAAGADPPAFARRSTVAQPARAG